MLLVSFSSSRGRQFYFFPKSTSSLIHIMVIYCCFLNSGQDISCHVLLPLPRSFYHLCCLHKRNIKKKTRKNIRTHSSWGCSYADDYKSLTRLLSTLLEHLVPYISSCLVLHFSHTWPHYRPVSFFWSLFNTQFTYCWLNGFLQSAFMVVCLQT